MEGAQRWILFGVLLFLAQFNDFVVGQSVSDVQGTVSPTAGPLDESNFQTCLQMIREVMLTGGTQPGLDRVSADMYYAANPGPYPWSTSLGADQSDYLDDIAFIVHPYLAEDTVSGTVDKLNGSSSQRELWAEGFKNASQLAVDTCCDGSLFGFALPFSQNTSNAAGSVSLVEDLRYYVAVSGKLNQTDELFYTACPYTNIPTEPRKNTNFPGALTSGAARVVSIGLLLSLLIVA